MHKTDCTLHTEVKVYDVTCCQLCMILVSGRHLLSPQEQLPWLKALEAAVMQVGDALLDIELANPEAAQSSESSPAATGSVAAQVHNILISAASFIEQSLSLSN